VCNYSKTKLAETGCILYAFKDYDSIYFDNPLNRICLVNYADETVFGNGIVIICPTSKTGQNNNSVISNEYGEENK
jgi:hypothetical protein